MKKKLFALSVLSTSAIVSTAIMNKFVKVHAISKNKLQKSLRYKWRFGDINYTKSGTGKPLLLIHDLNAVSCSEEWKRMIPLLQKNYTVYAVDLMGCGHSEKPNMTYTNYLYVQLISDFIKSEIGHRTNVVASGEAASIPVMACANDPDLFDQLMLINPFSILEYSQIPGKRAKFYKMVVDFPILGTLLYHIATSKKAIKGEFYQRWFYDTCLIEPSWIDAYYESAHLGYSPKSVYASQKCNYTKCNIVNALKKIDNSICLVGGEKAESIWEKLKEYQDYNSAVEIALIPKTKLLPQMEAPEKLYDLIKTYFG